MQTTEKINNGQRIIDNMDVDVSPEAYAIMKESWHIREPLNQHQKEIKVLVDEISFWQRKFSYMFGENKGLRYCLGLSVPTEKQSTNLRIIHKSNN